MTTLTARPFRALSPLRALPTLAALAFLTSTSAHAQVIEQNYPSSFLCVDLGATNNPFWTGWSLGGIAYGAGMNNQGASGYISHGYSFFPTTLTNIRVDAHELRNTGGPFFATNSPYAGIRGEVLFTPQANTNYTLSGAISMYLAGASTSNTLATGSLTLEVLSGPSLATYSAGVFRSGNGGFAAAGNIFDSATPTTGSSTGLLTANTTYRLAWNFAVSSNMNNDSTLSADVATAPGGSFFDIAFTPIPTPTTAATLLTLTALTTTRRRNRA